MNTTTTTAEAFHVYWTNFQYFAHENPHATIDAALQYGRSKCFDFQVFRAATDANPYREPGAFELVAAWSVIGGTRYYRKSADEAAELDGGTTLHAPQTVSQPCGAHSGLAGALVAAALTISASAAGAAEIYDATGRHIGPLLGTETTLQADGTMFRIGVSRTGFRGLAPIGWSEPGCAGESLMLPSDDLAPAAGLDDHGVTWVPAAEQALPRRIASVTLPGGTCIAMAAELLLVRADSPLIPAEEFEPPLVGR